MLSVAGWWLLVSIIGWSAWPLVAVLFQASPVRGCLYARTVGLLLVTYLFWVSSLTLGLPNVSGVWCGAVAVIGAAGAWQWRTRRGELLAVLGQERRAILLGEALFAACFALFALQRSLYPAAVYAEQPMDLAMLNGALSSPRLPPNDPWFSGHAVNYYYMGYLLSSAPIRLLRLTAGAGYTLALAQTFAMAVLCAYGVLYDLVRRAGPQTGWAEAGIATLGALALVLVSNLEGPLEALRAWGWAGPGLARWFGVSDLASAAASGSWRPLGESWWWRASRIITDQSLFAGPTRIITEFPAFSFILGDLHPHVMAMPFFLVALAVARESFAVGRDDAPLRTRRRFGLLLAPLVVGALGAINTWDLPAALGMCVVAFALGHYKRARAVRGGPRALADWLWVVALLAGSVALYLPFYGQMRPQVRGLAIAYWEKTPLRQYALCFGLWLVPIVANLVLAGIGRDAETCSRRLRLLAFWVGALTLPWLVVLACGGVGRLLLAIAGVARGGPWLVLALSLTLGLLATQLDEGARAQQSMEGGTEPVALAMAVAGVGITYATEFVYLRDAFGTRMNTVFKFYQQAWILLGIAATWSAWSLWRRGPAGRVIVGVAAALTAACLYYPVAAVSTRVHASHVAPTLDATAYLRTESPDEYAAVQWLMAHREGADIIVEAPGESYESASSRMSTLSGIPTIIGWAGHVTQWHGAYPAIMGRIHDVDYLYRTRDPSEALRLLRTYRATLLYVGPRERQRYALDEEALRFYASFLEPRFAQGATRIYAVPGR